MGPAVIESLRLVKEMYEVPTPQFEAKLAVFTEAARCGLRIASLASTSSPIVARRD